MYTLGQNGGNITIFCLRWLSGPILTAEKPCYYFSSYLKRCCDWTERSKPFWYVLCNKMLIIIFVWKTETSPPFWPTVYISMRFFMAKLSAEHRCPWFLYWVLFGLGDLGSLRKSILYTRIKYSQRWGLISPFKTWLMGHKLSRGFCRPSHLLNQSSTCRLEHH